MSNYSMPAGGVTPANRPVLYGYLTLKQLASELGRDVRTVMRWRLQRKGPPACKVCGRLLFKRADVLAWIEQQRECAA